MPEIIEMLYEYTVLVVLRMGTNPEIAFNTTTISQLQMHAAPLPITDTTKQQCRQINTL